MKKNWGVIAASVMSLVLLALLVTGFQNAGIVGLATVNFQVWSGQTSPTTSTPFRDIGQSSHTLQYCVSAGTTAVNVFLEGSGDSGAHWAPISNVSTLLPVCGTANKGGAVVTAGGYFGLVRANVSLLAGGSPSISAWYSATDGPVTYATPTNQSVANGSIIQCSFNFANNAGVGNNATARIVAGAAGSTIYVCWYALYNNGNAASTAGNLVFVEGTGTNCGTATTNMFNIVTASTTPAGLFASAGSGLGYVFSVIPGQDLCLTSITTGSAYTIVGAYTLL